MRISILKNKKGYSTGFTWIFGLVTLFGLGVLFIVFDQVFLDHLVPTIKNMNNNSYLPVDQATKDQVNAGIDKYIAFWHALPYVLFFCVVIYMIVAAFRREREELY
jgi:type III secretory pathway component EscU